MFEKIWQATRPLLFPLSLLYSLIIKIRNLLYDKRIFKVHELSTPVISIGNISVGGTGKTPVTLALCELIQKSPYKQKPAILSRGYGRKGSGYQVVCDGKKTVCDWATSGDETQIFAQRLKNIPVVVHENRVEGGVFLLDKFSPSVILLDDAFQHRRIHRDLDIVLIDCRSKPRDERLLPSGLLREPKSSQSRADLILLTHYQPEDVNSAELWNQLATQYGEERLSACRTKVARCSDLRTGKKISLSSLENKKMVGFCGIARPEGFASSLDHLGIDAPYIITFKDHHPYGVKDVERLAMTFNQVKAQYLITTEKDAVKLDGLFHALPILVLQIDIEWVRGFETIERELERLFNN